MNKDIKNNIKHIRKKIIVIMFLIILLFNTSQPIFAITDSGSDRWVPGQWASQIYTTDSKGSTGMIMRRLTSYDTQEQVTTFCAEFGVEAETRCNCNRNTFCTIRCCYKKACKVAYFGWYAKYRKLGYEWWNNDR